MTICAEYANTDIEIDSGSDSAIPVSIPDPDKRERKAERASHPGLRRPVQHTTRHGWSIDVACKKVSSINNGRLTRRDVAEARKFQDLPAWCRDQKLGILSGTSREENTDMAPLSRRREMGRDVATNALMSLTPIFNNDIYKGVTKLRNSIELAARECEYTAGLAGVRGGGGDSGTVRFW